MRFSSYLQFIILLLIILNPINILAKKAAIVVDFDTKEPIIEINADTLNFPASLTKMMTIYITFDYLKDNKLSWKTKLRVSQIAADRSPSKLNLKPGESITVEDSINALIVKSANDVATVIAEHISGSEREFAKLMTKYARKLGMQKTTFKNASGLPNRAQMTTARDMSILSYSLINNFPENYQLFSQKNFFWNGKKYKSHNKLMNSYNGADGIKTGYTYRSGFQLAFSAIRNNKRLIGIVFGGDTAKERDKTLRIIMDTAFNKISKNSKTSKIIKEKPIDNYKYSIVVGTFKYEKNAYTQLKIILRNYPKTTSNKDGEVIKIKKGDNYLYESRFKFFSRKEASKACNRLKKYNRGCFIRG
ncbi:MAG: D-alanyl-D-alanine carboxypeptidase DacF [Alphaproteobacteria bacterium MarineAlpha5_Bin9]|nr:MAG: D-alanyl-D-alanine carboxypeptidase DacF [Alphaproteobacteria bacterium MarineAlpha5_Bin9]|tara:strand:- start:25199 stop:26281 length:1083 start_codon:yes stop_codon:yes gene_type:complete